MKDTTRVLACLLVCVALTSCFSNSGDESSASAAIGIPASSLPTTTTDTTTATDTAWVPSVAGVSASNHDSNVSISKTVTTSTGHIIGLTDPEIAAKEITVTIDMTKDLGAYGSLSLVAETTGFPSALSGGAMPYLVYLSDGTNDLINLSRTGAGGDCAASGFYTCPSGVCSTNTSCVANWPTAYFDRYHWEQHQMMPMNYGAYLSVNTFPTCNWSGGSNPSSTDSKCAFNSNFFVSSKLRSGVTYTAKYVLVSDSYASLTGYDAGLRVTAIKKTDTTATKGGTLDVNVILVGHTNVAASRTAKGKQNLNTLFTKFNTNLGQSGSNMNLGTITAIEWDTAQGGDAYADIADTSLGEMLQAGSALLPTATETKAVNIYLINNITSTSGTILGESAGIGGAMINGTVSSGVTFSTFGLLDTYNPDCTGTEVCPDAKIESAFNNMEIAVTHETGHFLGLNHPSEKAGTRHDVVLDTPICTATSNGSLTVGSCLLTDTNVYSPTGFKCSEICAPYSSSAGTYCPDAVECEFNYLMFYSTKYFKEGTGLGDGNIISPDSGQIINYNPLVQ